MTAIKGMVTMLLEKRQTIDPALAQYLDVVNRESDHLNRLVNDLSEVAHIDSGIFRLAKTTFTIQELIAEVMDGWKNTLSEAHMTFDSVVDPHIPPLAADRDRVKQIFNNLINNAIYYSPAGGVIKLVAESKTDRVYCQITDTGPGIPKEMEKHIFEKFNHAEAKSVKRLGTGLGLYIVKKIIDVHGGRIWFHSVEGSGTTFYFTVPYV
jgi:signal transduction histidine kinase